MGVLTLKHRLAERTSAHADHTNIPDSSASSPMKGVVEDKLVSVALVAQYQWKTGEKMKSW
jgi:hypothetical protein